VLALPKDFSRLDPPEEKPFNKRCSKTLQAKSEKSLEETRRGELEQA
jgi:hypothetical protein